MRRSDDSVVGVNPERGRRAVDEGGMTTEGATMGKANDDEAVRAGDAGTVPTDTRGDGGIGTADGVSGVGLVGTSFGVSGNVPEPPGVDEEPVTIENEDDPDAIAHRGERRGRIAPDGVGPEVLPPS